MSMNHFVAKVHFSVTKVLHLINKSPLKIKMQEKNRGNNAKNKQNNSNKKQNWLW